MMGTFGIYTMLEDDDNFNWNWTEKEVKEFDRSYNNGMNVFQLADKFDRDADEVAVMIICRGRKGKLRVKKAVS